MQALIQRYQRRHQLALNETTTDLGRIQILAPSVFADRPAHDRSERYSFIPTSDVVRKLLDEGFVVSRIQEQRAKSEEKLGFTRHMLRFRHGDLLPEVGGLVPEVVLTNSHDGTSAFQMTAGVYRLVCSNGLVAGGDQYRINQRHSGSVDDVIEGVFRVVEDLPQAVETLREWEGIRLNENEQLAFAKAAIPLRFDTDENGNAPVAPQQLLLTRRSADLGDSLATTFNKVQENILKGGVRAKTSNGSRRRTVAVNSVREDVRLNRSLWLLAEAMAEHKLAA